MLDVLSARAEEINIDIVIDAHYVGVRYGGNETYFYNLIRNMADLTNSEGVTLHVLVKKRDWLPPTAQPIDLRSNNVAIQRAIEIPYHVLVRRPSIVHVPSALPFFKFGSKRIVTIHDILFTEYPSFYAPATRVRLEMFTKKAVRDSDGIITVSEYSKRTIVERYGVPADKVLVTYNAPDPSFALRDTVSDGGKLKKPYFLFVGTIQPRKNVVRLIRAFKQSGLGSDFDLIIAGALGWGYREFIEEMGKVDTKNVHFHSNVDDQLMLELYSNAYALAYPAIAEGFGLPLVEAMVSGLPIITSKGSALGEVVGDSALFVDPLQQEEICNALISLARDPSLRNSLAMKSKARASVFSWTDTAVKTYDFYKKVLSSV